MAELADAQDLGSCVFTCRFDPCYPHQALSDSRRCRLGLIFFHGPGFGNRRAVSMCFTSAVKDNIFRRETQRASSLPPAPEKRGAGRQSPRPSVSYLFSINTSNTLPDAGGFKIPSPCADSISALSRCMNNPRHSLSAASGRCFGNSSL